MHSAWHRPRALAALFLLVLALVAFAPLPAIAANALVTCTPPTKRTDGTAYTNPGGFRIYRGATAAAAASATTPAGTIPAGQPCSYQDTAAPSGVVFYVVTAVDTNGNESARSSAATVNLSPPETPTNVQATVVVQAADTNAYKLRQSVDGLQLVAFGTVPAGTTCDASKVVNGYALVPRSAVTPRSRFEPLPLVAFARCG